MLQALLDGLLLASLSLADVLGKAVVNETLAVDQRIESGDASSFENFVVLRHNLQLLLLLLLLLAAILLLLQLLETHVEQLLLLALLAKSTLLVQLFELLEFLCTGVEDKKRS